MLVSDASPLAGLPPGRHGAWEVEPSGKVVVAGTPYLAGSNRGIEVGVDHLIRFAEISPCQAIDAATRQPARLLNSVPGHWFRHAWPDIRAGEPANLIRFRRPAGWDGELEISDIVLGFDRDRSRPPSEADRPRFVLQATCVDGQWSDREPG